MKNLLLTAIAMVAPVLTPQTIAQTPALYDCIYSYETKGEHKGKPVEASYNCALRIGDGLSKFYDYSSFKVDSISSVPGIKDDILNEYREMEIFTDNYFDRAIVTDQEKGKITVDAPIGLEHYSYEEKIPAIKWNLTAGTDTVCGYVCNRAEGDYQGRHWTVWYAEEIPVPFGPWKLSGLPGLVLKGEDDSGSHRFSAVSFRQGSGMISERKIPNVMKISHDKFEKMKNRFDRNPMNSIPQESISDITVRKDKGSRGAILINGIRIRDTGKNCVHLEIFPDDKADEKQKPSKKRDSKDDIKVIGVATMSK